MPEREQITLEVQGMTCDGCAAHVERALSGVAGVEEVTVLSWRTGRATMLARPDLPDEVLIRSVEAAGYRATVRERRAVGEGQRFASRGDTYDLIIVGGGSAAFAAAIKAAELGAKVALVEVGTVCSAVRIGLGRRAAPGGNDDEQDAADLPDRARRGWRAGHGGRVFVGRLPPLPDPLDPERRDESRGIRGRDDGAEVTPAFSDVERFLASFSDDEIRITRYAFRGLLAGQATEVQVLPVATGLSSEAVAAALDSLFKRGTITVEGEPGRITAARGLSLAETRHRLEIDDRMLYAFCAVDAVGIPAALQLDAVARSRCHHCGVPLELAFAQGRVARAPEGVMIWAAERDLTRNLREHT